MPVPLLDLKLQYATIRDEVLRVTSEVYDSQYFILGKRVDDFERDFAAYCHSRYAAGVSSGTDALLIALMVLDIGPGDEVIVPAYSFFATARRRRRSCRFISTGNVRRWMRSIASLRNTSWR